MRGETVNRWEVASEGLCPTLSQAARWSFSSASSPTTANKTAGARLLTILRINPGETDPARPLKIAESRSGTTLTLVIDAWIITAEMDPAAPLLLSATDQRTAAILTGSAAQSLQFDGKTHTADQKGMTLLVEKRAQGCTVQQARDTLLDAALYSNRP